MTIRRRAILDPWDDSANRLQTACPSLTSDIIHNVSYENPGEVLSGLQQDQPTIDESSGVPLDVTSLDVGGLPEMAACKPSSS